MNLLALQPTPKKEGASVNTEAPANLATHHFSGLEAGQKDLRVFTNWYSTTAVENITFAHYSVLQPTKTLRCVFLPESKQSKDSCSFEKQFTTLVMLRNSCQASMACFIAFEPTKMDNHFIFGALVNRQLLIIDPLGNRFQEKNYASLIKAVKTCNFSIVVSRTVLQRDPDGLVSCGVLSAELMRHIATLSVDDITKVLADIKAERCKLKLENNQVLPYEVIDIANTTLLPVSLYDLHTLKPDVDYQNKIVAIRHGHFALLEQGVNVAQSEQVLFNQLLMDAKFLDALSTHPVHKVLVRRFSATDEKLSTSALIKMPVLSTNPVIANTQLQSCSTLIDELSSVTGIPIFEVLALIVSYCFKLKDIKYDNNAKKPHLQPSQQAPIGKVAFHQAPPKVQVKTSVAQKENTLFRLDKRTFERNLNLIYSLYEDSCELEKEKNVFQQSKLIISIFDFLMKIPHKYGRTNIEKKPGGKWNDSKYLIQIGLPTLTDKLNVLKELSSHGEVKDAEYKAKLDALLSKNLVLELKKSLPVIAINLMKYQLYEEVTDKNGKLILGQRMVGDDIKHLTKDLIDANSLQKPSESKIIKDIALQNEKINKINEKISKLKNELKLIEEKCVPDVLKDDYKNYQDLKRSANKRGKIINSYKDLDGGKDNEKQLEEKKNYQLILDKIKGNAFACHYQKNKASLEEKFKDIGKKRNDIDNLEATFGDSQKELDALQKRRSELENADVHSIKNSMGVKKRYLSMLGGKSEFDAKAVGKGDIKQLGEIKLTYLGDFQRIHDQCSIREILINYRRKLALANTNITIMSTFIDFVGWQKEGCSEEMRNKIEQIVPVMYFQGFRGFRNRAMHCLDNVSRLELVAGIANKENLIYAKSLLIKIIGVLLQDVNLSYLQGDNNQPKPYVYFIRDRYSDHAIRHVDHLLPELPAKYMEGSSETVELTNITQMEILQASIANAVAIIDIFIASLQVDLSKQINLNKILSVLASKDENLNDNDLQVKLKYDALLQALGQALGNLQQYETLKDFSYFGINATDYKELHEVVPLIKDYRSSRTHSGYYNIDLIKMALTDIFGTVHSADKLKKELISLGTAVMMLSISHNNAKNIGVDQKYDAKGLQKVGCKIC